jgi:hypothetical protein
MAVMFMRTRVQPTSFRPASLPYYRSGSGACRPSTTGFMPADFSDNAPFKIQGGIPLCPRRAIQRVVSRRIAGRKARRFIDYFAPRLRDHRYILLRAAFDVRFIVWFSGLHVRGYLRFRREARAGGPIRRRSRR